MSNFNSRSSSWQENKEFISKRFVYPTRKPLKFLSVGYKFPYDFDLKFQQMKLKTRSYL